MNDRRDEQRNSDLIQHRMVQKILEQPYRSPADNLIRYDGLNNRFRPVPVRARYFLVDLKQGKVITKTQNILTSNMSKIDRPNFSRLRTGTKTRPVFYFGPTFQVFPLTPDLFSATFMQC